MPTLASPCGRRDVVNTEGGAVEHRSSSVTVHSGLPSRTRSGADSLGGVDGVDGVDGLDYGVV